MEKLLNWISALPEEATVFTVCSGSGRKLEQIYKVVLPGAIENGWTPKPQDKNEVFQALDLDDLADQVQGVLEDTGYGIEYVKARVYAYSVQGKHIKSKLITKQIPIPQGDYTDSAIQALAQANISMTNEVRRTLANVTDNNARLLEIVTQLTEGFVSAKRDQVIAEQERLAYEMVLEAQEIEENKGIKEEGLSLLSQIANTVLEQKRQSSFDTESLKEHIKNNPGVVDDFIDDPEIINAVMASMAKQAQEG